MLRPVHLRRFLKHNNILVITPKKTEHLIITDKKELKKIILETMNQRGNPMVESSSSHEIRNAKR
mgnify:CR=1 FL=1